MIIFSGSSNEPLAKKIASRLGVKMGKIDLSRFANRESRVFIPEKIGDGEVVVVVQSLSNPPDEHLVEFCLICDALKRLGVGKIVGVIPWFGYSKQDQVYRRGEPLSVDVISRILQIVAIDKLITLDLHNTSIIDLFKIPVVNLSSRQLFTDYYKRTNKRNLIVVSPDEGAVNNSTLFAQELNVPVALIKKERDLVSGKVKILGINREVKGKRAVIIDDMIATGSTLIEAAKILKKKGVSEITVAVTHQLFLPGVVEKIEKEVSRIIITDSVRVPAEIKLKKTRILSCSRIIADVIK